VFLRAFDRAGALAGRLPSSTAGRQGFARCIAAAAPPPSPSSSPASPAARLTRGRPALGLLWLLGCGFGLGLGGRLRIAQQPENAWLDRTKGLPGAFFTAAVSWVCMVTSGVRPTKVKSLRSVAFSVSSLK